MQRRLWYIMGSAAIVGLVVWFAWPAPKTSAPTTNTNSAVVTNTATNVNTATSLGPTVSFTTADIPERDASFDFRLTLPSTWRVEYLSVEPAMNFYIPKSGVTALRQTQLFVTTAQATSFSVPTGIVGTATTSTTSDRHEYRKYVLAATNQTATDTQPNWWAEQRTVVVVASDTTKRSVYTTLNFAPGLSSTTIDTILTSLQLEP